MSRFINPFNTSEVVHLDKETRLEYEASLKAYRDLTVVLNESFDKGKIEGIEKTALNMIKEGFDNQLISKITGLSIDKIEELKKNIS